MPTEQEDAAQERKHHGKLMPFIMMFPVLMANLDTTTVLTALPSIADDLRRNPSEVSVIVTIYILSMVVSMPLTGWLCGRFGPKAVFLAAIFSFVSGSTACALAGEFSTLTGARILQGMGAGLMTPVGRIILQREVAPKDMISAIAWYTTPAMIGPMLGPSLGGALLTWGSWHLVFLINVPIGIGALIFAGAVLRPGTEETRKPFDLKGYLLLVGGLGMVYCGIEGVKAPAVGAPFVAALVIGGLGLVIAYALTSRRRADVLIDLKVLRIDIFTRTLIGSSIFRLNMAALPFLMAIIMQEEFAMTPADTGVLLSCIAVGGFCAKPLAGPILRKGGYLNSLLVFSVMPSVFMICLSLTSISTPWIVLAVLFWFSGFTRAMQFTAMNSLIYTSVPRGLVGDATTLSSIFIQFSLGLGVVLSSVIYSTALIFPIESPGFFTLRCVAVISATSLVAFVGMPKSIGQNLLSRN